MKKILLLLCLCLGFAANALELTEAHEKAIENTVKHYQNILKQDFNANISCPQIFGLINAMLMMQAKAANAPKNVPVPTINSVRRTHNAKKSTDKYSVNWGRLPKEMADKLSEGIDEKLEAFGDVCSALTLDGLKEIAEYASDNDAKLMQENPNQFVVSVTGLDEELVEGAKITAANICFNKKFFTVDYVKLVLLGIPQDIFVRSAYISQSDGIAFDGAVVGEAFGQAERVDAELGQLFNDLLFGGDDKAFGEEAAVAEEKREFHE